METAGNYPLIIYLLTALISGVLLGYYLGLTVPLWLAIGLVIVGILLCHPFFLRRKRNSDLILLAGVFAVFCFGSIRLNDNGSLNHPRHFSNLINDESILQVRLLEEPERKANSYGCTTEVIKVDNQSAKGKLLLYFESTDDFEAKYGDVCLLDARLAEIKNRGNPMEFDYATYVKYQGIGHQAFVKADEYEKLGEDGNALFSWLYGLRNSLDKKISHSGMEPANQAIAKALLLGNSTELDYDVRSSFASAGVMHVLAVSGLHLGIVFLLLSVVLKPLKGWRFGKLFYLTLILLGIWFFALFTALSPSVFRAAVMFSFVAIGAQLQRETSIYQSLMVSAFVLILIDPLIIFQIGFQLSYLAVIAIVYLQPRIYRLLYVPNKWLDKGWQLMAVSLAAQIGTFPLGLYYFHQFPNYFLISNLVVIPLVFVIVFVALIYALTYWLPFINDLVLYVFDLCLTVLTSFVGWIDSLPFSSARNIYLNAWELITIYGCIFLILIGVSRKKFGYFLVSIAALCGLFGYEYYRKLSFAEDRQIVFYNTKEVLIDSWDGYHLNTIQAEGLKNEPREVDFARTNFFSYRSVGMTSSEIHSPSQTSMFEYKSGYIGLVDSTGSDSIPKGLSVAYLHHIRFLPQEVLNDWTTSLEYLICGPEVGFKLKEYCSHLFGEKFVDLKEGAFILRY